MKGVLKSGNIGGEKALFTRTAFDMQHLVRVSADRD